jgi:hypothetical protein
VAPNFIKTSCGIVPLIIWTLNIFFFAFSLALLTADGTSFALPKPIPTWPFPSPTATTELNLNLLPPVTTLATRLIVTTFSSNNSNSEGFTILLSFFSIKIWFLFLVLHQLML